MSRPSRFQLPLVFGSVVLPPGCTLRASGELYREWCPDWPDQPLWRMAERCHLEKVLPVILRPLLEPSPHRAQDAGLSPGSLAPWAACPGVLPSFLPLYTRPDMDIATSGPQTLPRPLPPPPSSPLPSPDLEQSLAQLQTGDSVEAPGSTSDVQPVRAPQHQQGAACSSRGLWGLLLTVAPGALKPASWWLFPLF